MSVKSQWDIVYVEKIVLEIQVPVSATGKKILRLVNTGKTVHRWRDISGAVVTGGDIVDTNESLVINPSDRINYWLITATLLSIARFVLLLVVTYVYYHMQLVLTILHLLSY